MEIPVPPGATKIKKFRISGNVNSNGITFSLYQSGWNNATNNYISNTILSGIAINGAPFNELFTIDRSIDPETHTIALYVVANGSSDIFLVAAEFE